MTIIMIVEANRIDWEYKINFGLWSYQTTYKTSIGISPFDLVFRLEIILPIEFLVPSLRVAKQLDWIGHEFSNRIDELEKLDEHWIVDLIRIYVEKRQKKCLYETHVKSSRICKGDCWI